VVIIFESLKNLYSGKIEECKNHMLFPILRWTTGHTKNIEIANLANKYFFYVKPEIIKSILYYGLPIKYVSRYPKKIKPDNSFVFKYIQEYFNYSYKELNFLIPILNLKLENKEFKIKLSQFFGLDKKENKQLGIDYKYFDKTKIPQKSANLMNF